MGRASACRPNCAPRGSCHQERADHIRSDGVQRSQQIVIRTSQRDARTMKQFGDVRALLCVGTTSRRGQAMECRSAASHMHRQTCALLMTRGAAPGKHPNLVCRRVMPALLFVSKSTHAFKRVQNMTKRMTLPSEIKLQRTHAPSCFRALRRPQRQCLARRQHLADRIYHRSARICSSSLQHVSVFYNHAFGHISSLC